MAEKVERVIKTPMAIRVMFIFHSLISDSVEGDSLPPSIYPMFVIRSISRLL